MLILQTKTYSCQLSILVLAVNTAIPELRAASFPYLIKAIA